MLQHNIIPVCIKNIQREKGSITDNDQTGFHYVIVFTHNDKFDVKKIPGIWLDKNKLLCEELNTAIWMLDTHNEFDAVLRCNNYKGHININGIRPADRVQEQIINEAIECLEELKHELSNDNLDEAWDILRFIRHR